MASPKSLKARDQSVASDAVCLGCECACDDIELLVTDGNAVPKKNACELGRDWFRDRAANHPADCWVDGKEAPIQKGIERAAELLTAARLPLIFGLAEATVEAQRAAAGLADRVGGCIDVSAADPYHASALAFQRTGKVTCSLGEVKNRADLLLYWGTDPIGRQPRHQERFATRQNLTSDQRRPPMLVVDSKETRTAQQADFFLRIGPGQHFEAVWTLRALLAGVALDPGSVRRATGQALDRWQDLLQRMESARYGVLFFGERLTGATGKHANVEAAFRLVRDLNRVTRFVCLENHGHGNSAGAENVLAWRTGFPCAVNFSRGYPRFGPGEWSGETLLTRGESDLSLVLSGSPLCELEGAALENFSSQPKIVFGYRTNETMQAANVSFFVKSFTTETVGTVFRIDDVPLPLRPALPSSTPSSLDILRQIESAVAGRIRPSSN